MSGSKNRMQMNIGHDENHSPNRVSPNRGGRTQNGHYDQNNDNLFFNDSHKYGSKELSKNTSPYGHVPQVNINAVPNRSHHSH